MNGEREINQQLANKAIRTVESISRERDIKGNANVAAGRYGELVANMVRYAEAQMALQMIDSEEQQHDFSATQALSYGSPTTNRH